MGKDSRTGRLPFRVYCSLPLCGKPQAALRTFPHSVSVPTAHSGVRLENDPEAPLLLCQKKVSRSCDSKHSYSDSPWDALSVNTEGTYLDDSHSKVHMFLHQIVGAEAVIQLAMANTV